MNVIKRFGSFWYHFIIGDDWRIAAGGVLGLGVVGLIVHTIHSNVWWLLPILIMSILLFTVRSVANR